MIGFVAAAAEAGAGKERLATSSVTVGWAIPSLRWLAVAGGGGITQVGGGGIA